MAQAPIKKTHAISIKINRFMVSLLSISTRGKPLARPAFSLLNIFISPGYLCYFIPRVLSMNATMCSAQYLKASSADPQSENLSVALVRVAEPVDPNILSQRSHAFLLLVCPEGDESLISFYDEVRRIRAFDKALCLRQVLARLRIVTHLVSCLAR